MELSEGIQRVLDHEGILFLGSGFSIGGKNLNGENLKVGADLSKAICRDLGISESSNLAISSQRYIEDPTCKKSLAELIDFLRKEVFCAETSEVQDYIAKMPWKRIYTTNYDNAFETASKKNGLERKSITITNSRYVAGRQLEQAIIHINGSILNIDEERFYDEFKITDENYTRDGLLQSTWVNMFDMDLNSAKVVVFIGYSLQYDQELVRHLANLNIQDKCIFIDIDFNDEEKEYKIRRYGRLYKIGADGFAREAQEISKDYVPHITSKKITGFIKRELTDYFSDRGYSSNDELDLLIRGKIQTSFMNQKGYCVSRKKVADDIVNELENNDVIVIQSRLGNGKTTFLECLSNILVEKYNVYYVANIESMMDDLDIIQSNQDRLNILLIDDYGYFTPLLKEIGKNAPNDFKLILTCRTSININLFSDLTEKYGYSEDRVKLFDIDEMVDNDIAEVIEMLDTNRLWGRYDQKTFTQKKSLVQKQYSKQFSKLFYLLLDSKAIKQKIDSLIISIKGKQGLFDYILAQAINSICNLKFTSNEIEEYVNISDSLLRSYTIDKNVREVLCISDGEISLSSSIFSQYLVKESGMRSEMMEMLEKIYRSCSYNDEAYGKYYQQRRNMVSRSNIILLLNANGNEEITEDDEKSILNYFDKIKNLPTATKNPYFWLQFGITALNLENYKQASIYFENAYTNANRMADFDTFQIDTHKARLLLCREMDTNKNNADAAIANFIEAHKLLYNNSNKGEKNKYVLRQVGRYYEYFLAYKAIFSEEQINKYLEIAVKMNTRFVNYFESMGDRKLPLEVSKAFRDYRRLFEKTPYILMLREVDSLYNAHVTDARLRVR